MRKIEYYDGYNLHTITTSKMLIVIIFEMLKSFHKDAHQNDGHDTIIKLDLTKGWR